MRARSFRMNVSALPRQIGCKLVVWLGETRRLHVPVVQGIGQKGVSEAIAQIGRTWVSAMHNFAVAARGL